MVIGIVATALVIAAIYLSLVAADIANFSGLALGAAALLSIPGGAVLGLLIASDADPADDD
jgi:hypothetical protein